MSRSVEHRTHPTPAERAEVGKTAREATPVEENAQFQPAADRADPVAILEKQAKTRVPELVPVRYGRMLVSPFTFFRGAAAGMAADLAGTADSGLTVQLCGDAHLSNFGMFASPERSLVFDVNDFDETHPGPWEWDVKRLAASLEIAARDNEFGPKKRRRAVMAAARGYQQAMAEFAGLKQLDLWYARADVEELRGTLKAGLKKARRKTFDKALTKARGRTSVRAFGRLTGLVDGRRRILPDPPLIMPVRDLLPDVERAELEERFRRLLSGYRSTLQSDTRRLLDSFDFVDLARKVVGVGSVGTRCWIVLMRGRDGDDPLFLQVKEAQRSVIAEYGGRPTPERGGEGERVVHGQRLMQAVSDIFLGWQSVEGIDGRLRDFYVRQLADWKGSFVIEGLSAPELAAYGRLCGWSLARAHARSGDRIAIAAYLGEGEAFPESVADFAALYADQNERDYAALNDARRSGRIPVLSGL
ncbi:uncharacterized protein (DUF2252 family) [Catenulispora sp. GAS73]|uniref:DUF2252 domain-containing protein n=1 Tax=Catenulispora sp. GAS73 TaxID=3156269 RepID=UPI0035138F36